MEFESCFIEREYEHMLGLQEWDEQGYMEDLDSQMGALVLSDKRHQDVSGNQPVDLVLCAQCDDWPPETRGHYCNCSLGVRELLEKKEKLKSKPAYNL